MRWSRVSHEWRVRRRGGGVLSSPTRPEFCVRPRNAGLRVTRGVRGWNPEPSTRNPPTRHRPGPRKERESARRRTCWTGARATDTIPCHAGSNFHRRRAVQASQSAASSTCASTGRLRQSIVTGRSHCDACKRQIRSTDLIPVLSYLALRGAAATAAHASPQGWCWWRPQPGSSSPSWCLRMRLQPCRFYWPCTPPFCWWCSSSTSNGASS